VRINHGSFLPNRSTVGNDVFIGPNVTFTDDKYPRSGNKHYKAEPPIVEDNVSVGAGAIILPGIRLGKGCMIGAGAVVTEDVEPGMTVVGMPARIL
jgi:acetyltransferase-like isoleucine patch superfamily enzyme